MTKQIYHVDEICEMHACVHLTGVTFYDQPTYWQNFTLKCVHTRRGALPYVENELAKYDARWVSERIIQFKNLDTMWEWIWLYAWSQICFLVASQLGTLSSGVEAVHYQFEHS